MKREKFDLIIKDVKKENCNSELGNLNISVYQRRWRSGDENLQSDVIRGFERNGNEYKYTDDAIKYIRDMYKFDVFTDDEWNEIIKHIKVFDFNNDFENMCKEVKPLFLKIAPWKEDWDLEFWQGIFSLDKYEYCCDFNEDKSIEQTINSPENGEEYCSTLLKIYPIIKKLVDKYPGCVSSLRKRICNDNCLFKKN